MSYKLGDAVDQSLCSVCSSRYLIHECTIHPIVCAPLMHVHDAV